MSGLLGAGKAALSFIPPQTPTLVEQPPPGDGWIHEVKHDGYRMQLIVDGAVARIFSRSGLDWTAKFPHIAPAAVDLPCKSAILDGEMVVQDDRGIADFDLLRSGRGSPVFIAFDLLHLGGKDMRRLPLSERRDRLGDLVFGHGLIGFSEAWAGTAAQLLAAVEANGMEGIVSKRALSTYKSGPSRVWLKTKCWTESIVTLLGFELDSRGLPIALLAKDGEDGLEYAGGALVGMPTEVKAEIDRLAEIPRPLIAVPGRRKATWLDPTLRLRIRHLRGTGSEIRHASVVGLADALEV
jgi:bifunctional non-homologous end joining protein LigD